MQFEFKFPDVGEGITEGLLVKWRANEGDSITEDQIIAEIETDKAVVEIPSPKKGKIIKRHFAENDTIRVGEVLVTIETAETEGTKKTGETKPIPAVVGELKDELEFKTSPMPHPPAAPTSTVSVMPHIRELAKELKVDLTMIHGTGPGGRISETDVKRAAQLKNVCDAEKYGPVERVPFAGTRKSIAERLLQTMTSAALVTHFDFADVGELNKLRKQIAASSGKISIMPFFVRAVTTALKEFPIINSCLDEVSGEIVYKKYYHIGIAVDTEHGLIVPVVKDADKKSLEEISKILIDLTGRAKNRTIGVDELHGGTFTISNVGMIGGTFATPIMPYPQTAILAIGKIRETAVVKEGKIAVETQAPLSLSFDHRLIDGADAARFTNRLIELLHNP